METTAQPTFSVRKIVFAGVLGGIAILLSVSKVGLIPVPNLTGNATIMHVPAIIGGVLEGPVVGAVIGGIFGTFRFLQGDTPLVANPVVAIVPRLFIGVTAYYTYVLLKRWSEVGALAAAAIVGSLTNTFLFLGFAMLFGLFPATWAAVVPVIPQASAEVVIAVIINVAVVAVWKGIETGAIGGARKV
jgi:uncharacterized membrane protein